MYLNIDVIQRDYNQYVSMSSGDDSDSSGDGRDGSDGRDGRNFVDGSDDDMLNGWVGWNELSSLAAQLMACNCHESISNIDTKSSRNTGDIEDSDESDNSDDDYEDNSGEMRSSEQKYGYCNLPVLIVGVKGIPRDCLVEAEVASFSNMMPLSSFTSNQCIYHLPVTPSAASHALHSTVVSDTIVNDKAYAERQVNGLDGSHGDDLDTNLWPIWHRVDACPSIPRNDLPPSVSDSGSEIDRLCIDSHSSFTKEVVEDSCSSDAYPVSDIDPTLDTDSTPEYALHVSSPVSTPPCDQTDPCEKEGQAVLVGIIRTTQCSRCVCSGFSSVSLHGKIDGFGDTKSARGVVGEGKDEDEEGEGKNAGEVKHDGDGDGVGEIDKDKKKEKAEATSEGNAPSVYQQSADLLIFTVKERMLAAGMTIADVRTLRVYYQRDTLLDLMPAASSRSARSIQQNGYEDGGGDRGGEVGADLRGVDDGGVDWIEGKIQNALMQAARRAFGEHHNMPLILVPVVQLASPMDTLADTPGRPLLTSSFLFINLLQVKSEMWVGGH